MKHEAQLTFPSVSHNLIYQYAGFEVSVDYVNRISTYLLVRKCVSIMDFKTLIVLLVCFLTAVRSDSIESTNRSLQQDAGMCN